MIRPIGLALCALPLLVGLAANVACAKDGDLSLEEFLGRALKTRPELESARWREESAGAALESSRAAILPTIEAGPLIARGAPGGSSVLGWDGNISASMRSGQGFAGLIKYTAWDFGRTSSAVRAEAAELQAVQAENQRTQGELLLGLAQDYLECARNRSVVEALYSLKGQTAEIRDTIERLVKSGQRTPVEGHLARAQALEVETQVDVAQKRVSFEQRRLGLSIGMSAVSCLGLESLSSAAPVFSNGQSVHPWIASARANAEAARQRLQAVRSERYPRLQFFGNGGYFDSEKLDGPWNYSVSAALAIPLWDGKTGSEIRRAEANQHRTESDLQTVEMRLDTFLLTAEERYRVAEAQVRSLESEISEAKRGFEIARQRYQRSVGLLVELRETVRNLVRVSSSLATARTELLSSRFFLSWYRGSAAGDQPVPRD